MGQGQKVQPRAVGEHAPQPAAGKQHHREADGPGTGNEHPLALLHVAPAHRMGAEVVVFPELSLTGYDLPGMAQAALQSDDAVFEPLRERADDIQEQGLRHRRHANRQRVERRGV